MLQILTYTALGSLKPQQWVAPKWFLRCKNGVFSPAHILIDCRKKPIYLTGCHNGILGCISPKSWAGFSFFFQPASCMFFMHSPLQPKRSALVKMNRNTWVLSRWPDVVLMQPECSVSCRSLVAEQIKQSGIPELFGHLLYRLNVADLKNSKDLA